MVARTRSVDIELSIFSYKYQLAPNSMSMTLRTDNMSFRSSMVTSFSYISSTTCLHLKCLEVPSTTTDIKLETRKLACMLPPVRSDIKF